MPLPDAWVKLFPAAGLLLRMSHFTWGLICINAGEVDSPCLWDSCKGHTSHHGEILSFALARGKGQLVGVAIFQVATPGCVFIYSTNTSQMCTVYLLGVDLGARDTVPGQPLDLWKPQVKHRGIQIVADSIAKG